MLEDAKWIRATATEAGGVIDFYTEVLAGENIEKATLTITAVGMYIAYLNGKRVGNDLFTPGFTEYEKRIQYQEYDVTKLLGTETDYVSFNVLVSEGWAVGNIGYDFLKNSFADHVSVRFSLDIEYNDGRKQILLSDERVKVRTSKVTSSGVYLGDTIDETATIYELGYALEDIVNTTLVLQQGPPVREQEQVYAKRLLITPKGEKVLDFGQNLSGYVEIEVTGKAGERICISHAEVLDKDGNFYTDNLRQAKQQAVYVLGNEEPHVLKQLFSWQGFRYIRLDEFPESCEITPEKFKAIVVYSQMKRTGDFCCGNEKINQLYRNIIWGQKGNYIDVPTDCPQRDERLGWTGDAQVFVRTAAINYDVEQFFEKWLTDLALGQGENGEVFGIVPKVKLNYPTNISAAWGDAAVICPWEIYLAYGNTHILEQQFESMCRWIEYMHGAGEEAFLWLGGGHYGDWLAMDNLENGFVGATSPDYIASAFFAYSTSLVIKAGHVLGKDVEKYEQLYEKVRTAFRERYIANGVPVIKTQTACVLALHFHLCTDEEKTAELLVQMIRDNGMCLNTGFVGTPYLLHALSEQGYADIAYDLLFQEKCPSWLFSVNQGATTMWEHWDGIKEDGSFWDVNMNSFNHYAYGSVYDWIFGVAAGVKVLDDGAGYRHIRIAPRIDRRMGFLKASVKTKHGKVESAWYPEGDRIRLEITIPDTSVAEVVLPDGRQKRIVGTEAERYVFYCDV